MVLTGSKSATRRSLTLVEVLVVLLLIGLLSAGGLVMGKKALHRAVMGGEMVRLRNKLCLAQALAQAEEQPVAIILQLQAGKCLGRIESRRPRNRPFALRIERMLIEGEEQNSLRLQFDESGTLYAPSVTFFLGEESYPLLK
jgi:hypothetical protein